MYTTGGYSSTNPLPWANVFPTNVIPAGCQDPVAVDLLRFVPGANRSDGSYQAVPVSSERQDQFTVRIDHHINDHQNFSFYYYFTDDNQLQPFYNFQASGANIPGFGAKVGSRYQQYNPSHTWTISNSLVNEARFTYMREGQLTFQHPQNTGSHLLVLFFRGGPGGLFQWNVGFQRRIELNRGSVGNEPTIRHNYGPAVESHGSSIRGRCGWI